jgi:hypothetical protein
VVQLVLLVHKEYKVLLGYGATGSAGAQGIQGVAGLSGATEHKVLLG